MFAAWMCNLLHITPPVPAAQRTRAGRGWVLRLLRGIFLWRVRFSLRSLLLLASGLSAGIGASLRYEENPWQLTWRWSPPEDLAVERVELAPDGQRMAMLFEPTETLADERQPQTLLLFDRSGATPEVVYRPEVLDPLLFFDTQSRLRVADGGALVDADSGKTLLQWTGTEELAGVSEDGRTAATAEVLKPHAQIWDLETGTLRFALPAGNIWLDGPRSTPEGTRGVTLPCNPDVIPNLLRFSWSGAGKSNRSVALWDLDTGALVDRFEHSECVYGAALSPDGRWLLAGGDGFAVLWDVERDQAARRIQFKGRFTGGVLCPGGRRAVFHSVNTIPWENRFGYQPLGQTLVVNLDDNAQACALQYKPEPQFTTRAYDQKDKAMLERLPQFSPDGTRLIAFDSQHSAVVLDAATGHALALIESPHVSVEDCAPDAAVAAAAETVLLHDDRAVYRFERVRPEGDERILWIPEFWLAAVFTAALSVSLLRDGKISPQRPQRTARVG